MQLLNFIERTILYLGCCLPQHASQKAIPKMENGFINEKSV
jgi:hypothetical protein